MGSRTVLITGASSGIGEALALEYARSGARLALLARRKEELERVAQGVLAQGGMAHVYPVDVTDVSAVEDAVQRADRDLGSLDLVIANAGMSKPVAAPLLTVKTCTDIVDVNVRGALATLTAAIPSMVAARRGHLVGVTSLAGLRGMPGFGPYSATKAALSTFLETLRVELRPLGIRVTDVMPGFVETPLVPKDLFTPFMWPVSRAARHVKNKLERGPAVVAFPMPLVALMSVAAALPRFLYDPIMRAVVR